jgi:hypothetical protein
MTEADPIHTVIEACCKAQRFLTGTDVAQAVGIPTCSTPRAILPNYGGMSSITIGAAR